jgi:diguanylate cyclase (GGDEF)-like protein
LKEVGAGTAPENEIGEAGSADRVNRLRPEAQVVGLAILMAGATVALHFVTPDKDVATRSASWWPFVVAMVLFGLFDYFVFHFQFRREGIAFSLSEIPTALALVFLAPLPGLLARLPLTIIVLIAVRRNAAHKVVFNMALLLFELAATIALFRWLLERLGPGDSAIVLAVALALFLVSPLTSVLISMAISRFEGFSWRRIGDELRATWWMYMVNSVLAAMTISLALIEPSLALLAILPTIGIWFVLHTYGELGQELRDLDAVHGFAGRVGVTLDLLEISDAAVSETIKLLHAESVALVRFGEVGPPTIHTSGRIPIKLPSDEFDSNWSGLLESHRAVLVDRSELVRRGLVVAQAARSAIVALVDDETGPLAALIVVEQDVLAARFGPSDVARVQNLSEQLAASLRKGLLHERLEHEARHDALTGLPSRTPFEFEVGKIVRKPPDLVSCVLMLDLDRFKEVNDTLGHHAGDDLLIEFADRMTSLLQGDDVLARLAGDEFAILCCRDSVAKVDEFAKLCVETGGKPVVLDGLEIVVTVSCGVAEIIELDDDAVQSMRRADIAMYNAKWQRTGVEFYRDEIDRRTPARLSILGDLRTSIENDELGVVYQPKLDLATGQIIGVEALVRWDHSVRGVVPPSEFVRVAEDTGLIKELTDIVMVNGIKMLRRFSDAGLSLGLAVNLSTHDLFDVRLPERIRGHLESNDVAPELLTLEITESSLFVDAPRTRATIDDLHAVGLRMTIDDFGTGYSSLSYLRRLPVNELKIDQSFVYGMLTDPQDEVIVRSTVDLGHNLDLLVVAEGVESLAVLERLRDIGCDVAQGYYVSQPLGADALLDWLHKAASAHVAESPISWVGSVS